MDTMVRTKGYLRVPRESSGCHVNLEQYSAIRMMGIFLGTLEGNFVPVTSVDQYLNLPTIVTSDVLPTPRFTRECADQPAECLACAFLESARTGVSFVLCSQVKWK